MKLNTIGTNILRFLGFVNSVDPNSSIVPRPNTPASAERLEQDFQDADRVASPDTWSKYASTMRRPENFDSVLELWEEMASWDMMAAALTEIVDEASQMDQIREKTIWMESNDDDLTEKLNKMMVDINASELCQSQLWYLAGLGNAYEKIDYSRGDGVTGLTFVHPKNIRRFWLERNRKCIGFRWQAKQPDDTSLYVGPDGSTEIPRVSLSLSNNKKEDLWYPWDFMHFRRMFRMRSSEHGEAIFDEAQGIYKKLRMAVDQMVVHRAQIQPDRYASYIDTNEQSPTDQHRTVQMWKTAHRSKVSFGNGNAAGMTIPSEFRAFYDPWALDSVLWVARPKGYQHSVEKFNGTANVPDVYDIELLTELFCSIIGMPKSWFGIGRDPGQNSPSGKSLLAQDIRFLRKVRALRKSIVQQYTWLGNFHALLQNPDVELASKNIQAKMADIGGLEDQMKMELLDVQADVMSKLAGVMKDYNLPKEAWVELIFKRYLRLPSDVVDMFMTALPDKVEAQPAFDGLQTRRDATNIILERVANVIGPDAVQIRLAVKSAQEKAMRAPKSDYQKMHHVVSVPGFRAGDVILDGGTVRLKIKPSDETQSRKVPTYVVEGVAEFATKATKTENKPAGDEREPAYRRYMKS